MSGLFGSSSPPPPRKSDADVQAAAAADRKRRALAVGRSKTILAGEDEIAPNNLNKPQLATKTLLGQ